MNSEKLTFTEILKQLLFKFACHHVWKNHQRIQKFAGSLSIGYEDTLICEKCGKIKKIYL